MKHSRFEHKGRSRSGAYGMPHSFTIRMGERLDAMSSNPERKTSASGGDLRFSKDWRAVSGSGRQGICRSWAEGTT